MAETHQTDEYGLALPPWLECARTFEEVSRSGEAECHDLWHFETASGRKESIRGLEGERGEYFLVEADEGGGWDAVAFDTLHEAAAYAGHVRSGEIPEWALDVSYEPEPSRLPCGLEDDRLPLSWEDFMLLALGDARYAAELVGRVLPGGDFEGAWPGEPIMDDRERGRVAVFRARYVQTSLEPGAGERQVVEAAALSVFDQLDGVLMDAGGGIDRPFFGYAPGTAPEQICRDIEKAFGVDLCKLSYPERQSER